MAGKGGLNSKMAWLDYLNIYSTGADGFVLQTFQVGNKGLRGIFIINQFGKYKA